MKKASAGLSLFFVTILLVMGLAQPTQAIGISPQPTPPSQDDGKANCISVADMNQIAKDFKQYQNLAGKEFCFDGSQTAYLLAGLQYIRKIQFNQPMVNSPDELFTGKFAADWYGYFTKLIFTISIETNCPQGAVAYVQGFFHQNTMHVCPIGLTSAFTPLDLASVFLHEARHIEGYPHVTCSQGPRAGIQGACDKKISDAGSYSVTVETYAQLGQYGKDINPAFRAIAQASALIYGAEAFQTPMRINKEEAFLALTADKKLYKVDSSLQKQPELVGETAALGHLIKNKVGLIVLPEDKNQLLVRIFPTGETQNVANEYNEGTPANRANVVDYYFAWTWNARVEKNKIRFFCDKRMNPTLSSDVAIKGEALSIVYPEGYGPDKNYAFLTTTNGVVKISCESGKGVVSDAQISIDTDIKRIHKANNTTIALTSSGDILNLDNKSQRVELGLTNIVDVISYSRATFFDK